MKRYRQGKAGLQAHLDDYVFVIWGLLELYEAGFEEVYLQEALNLSTILVNNFWDEVRTGIFKSEVQKDHKDRMSPYLLARKLLKI